MKFTKFDKTNLKTFRELLAKKMAEFEAETGVKVELGSIRYNETTFSSQMSAIIANVVADPFLVDIPGKYIADLKKRFPKDALLKEITLYEGQTAAKYKVVGSWGNGAVIIRNAADPQAPLQKKAFSHSDWVYCQLFNRTYDRSAAELFSRSPR